MNSRWLTTMLLSVGLLASSATADAKPNATAPVVVEVAAPPSSLGANAVDLRTVAQGEVGKLDALPRGKRGVVISLALAETSAWPVACSLNTTVRDARTGAVLAILETGAHANGPTTPELRRQMAFSVVRTAMQRLPNALRTTTR